MLNHHSKSVMFHTLKCAMWITDRRLVVLVTSNPNAKAMGHEKGQLTRIWILYKGAHTDGKAKCVLGWKEILIHWGPLVEN